MFRADMDGGYAFFIFRPGARAPGEREGVMARAGGYLEDTELQEEILKIFEELIHLANGDSARRAIPESGVAASQGILPRLAGCMERVCPGPWRRR